MRGGGKVQNGGVMADAIDADVTEDGARPSGAGIRARPSRHLAALQPPGDRGSRASPERIAETLLERLGNREPKGDVPLLTKLSRPFIRRASA